jgi:betaine-aldehyde dehydrogenase
VRALRNVIGAESLPAHSGETTPLVNPTTGAEYGTAPKSGAADVDQAFAVAAAAFETWRETTPGERQAALLKIADIVEAHADELIALESENTGKPIAVTASEEIPPMVDQIRFFAGAARVLDGRSAGEYMKGFTSIIRREPVGVIAQVAPWNYPMMMAVWKFAPAIAAGNTVVLKPSDTTPASTVRIAELVRDAEALPPGVLNVICGDRDTGRALVDHPIPQMVAIIGTRRYGGCSRRSQGCEAGPSGVGWQSTCCDF